MPFYTINTDAITELQQKMTAFGAGSGQVIQQYLLEQGAPQIIKGIKPLIHPSGRTWKGKIDSAASAKKVFSAKAVSGQLAVRISSAGRYGYLYFPDDGSDSKRHKGGQDFMQRGAEIAADEVAEGATVALIQKFNE